MAWSAYFTLLGKLLVAAGAILTVVGILIGNTPLQVIGAIVGVLPVFLPQTNARGDHIEGGDDHRLHDRRSTTQNQPADHPDAEGAMELTTLARVPVPAVQSVDDGLQTNNSDDSLSDSRCNSLNAVTKPPSPIPPPPSRPVSRPASPLVPAVGAAPAGLSTSPTTAQSDPALLPQDPPSSTSPVVQHDTLHDTATLVQDPEPHRDIVEDSSHGADPAHINDTVLVEPQQATNHQSLRQRSGLSGSVRQLQNYYQDYRVATRFISYSHQAVPGGGYIATVTLSNFNPPAVYTGTGLSIQGAKEAAARCALQALGQPV